MKNQKGFTKLGMIITLLVVLGIGLTIAFVTFSNSDLANNLSRKADTILGADYRVQVIGTDRVFNVVDDKITSTANGYYILYPVVNGKKRLVQLPIHATIIEKVN